MNKLLLFIVILVLPACTNGQSNTNSVSDLPVSNLEITQSDTETIDEHQEAITEQNDFRESLEKTFFPYGSRYFWTSETDSGSVGAHIFPRNETEVFLESKVWFTNMDLVVRHLLLNYEQFTKQESKVTLDEIEKRYNSSGPYSIGLGLLFNEPFYINEGAQAIDSMFAALPKDSDDTVLLFIRNVGVEYFQTYECSLSVENRRILSLSMELPIRFADDVSGEYPNE